MNAMEVIVWIVLGTLGLLIWVVILSWDWVGDWVNKIKEREEKWGRKGQEPPIIGGKRTMTDKHEQKYEIVTSWDGPVCDPDYNQYWPTIEDDDDDDDDDDDEEYYVCCEEDHITFDVADILQRELDSLDIQSEHAEAVCDAIEQEMTRFFKDLQNRHRDVLTYYRPVWPEKRLYVEGE